MTAAQLAADRLVPEVPGSPAVRGTTKAALLSLLLHGAVLAAIAGAALQPQAPRGEAVFTIELVSAATAAAGSPQAVPEPATAEPAAAETATAEPVTAEPVTAKAAAPEPPAEAVESPPVQAASPPAEQPVQTRPPVQTALAESDAIPLPPEPAADIAVAPMPEAKPKARPRRSVQAAAKPAKPPATAPAAQPQPQAAAGPAAAAPQSVGQLGAEAQVASAPAGNSDQLPVVTQPRFRAPPRPPVYPPRARAMEQQGVSVVRALVDTDGSSREIRLWRSSGFDVLDRAALVAVRGWRFEAARRGEQPVLAWVEIPIRFELR